MQNRTALAGAMASLWQTYDPFIRSLSIRIWLKQPRRLGRPAGTVDYPAEIRPQRMPGLPHATTKQTLNRGRRRGSRGNRAILLFSFFFFIRSVLRLPRSRGTRNERLGNISLPLLFSFFFAHRRPPRAFYFSPFFFCFILSSVRGHATSRCNRRALFPRAEISWRIFRVTRS